MEKFFAILKSKLSDDLHAFSMLLEQLQKEGLLEEIPECVKENGHTLTNFRVSEVDFANAITKERVNKNNAKD